MKKYFVLLLFALCMDSSFAEQDMIEQLEQKIFKDSNQKYELADPIAPTLLFNENPIIDENININVKPKALKELNTLNQEIKSLDLEIAKISAEIEKTRQLIVQRANSDNFVKIAIKSKLTDQTSIQTINAKLDDFTILDNINYFPLAIADEELAIFYGPLSEGVHYLDINIRIGDHSKGALSANSDLFHVIQKRFNLEVLEGVFRKTWTIAIDPKEHSAELVGEEISQNAENKNSQNEEKIEGSEQENL